VHYLRYIPIDFIKAEVVGMETNIFYNNNLLEFHGTYNRNTGEVSEHSEAWYKNFKIKIFKSGRIWISGSLHVYYNNGKHNYNDFGYSEFQEALKTLKNELNIEPINLRILNLEWGFNIQPPTTTNYILDRLVQHLSVNRTVGLDCKIEGKYVQFKHSYYILKLYNKGMHYNLNKELFRLEIKQLNWSRYRAKGISTLQDFIECDKSLFMNELISQWENVILYDIDNSLTSKHIEYQTVTYWDNKRKRNSRRNVKYHIDKLNKLNNRIGFKTKNRIIELLTKKGNELQV